MHSYIMSTVLIVVILSLLTKTTLAGSHVVSTYNAKLRVLQISSTLEWQPFTSESQLKNAVHGGDHNINGEIIAKYVCRASIDGIPSSGHTQPRESTTVCIVSMFQKVHTHFAFDVLINKGNAAKLTWKQWNKFVPVLPHGAVSALTGGHVDDFYVARRKAKAPEGITADHHHSSGDDYNMGRFAPQKMGKIYVIDENNEDEYEDGQILVESEPIRYEIRDIKFNRLRTKVDFNATELNKDILVNDGANTVEVATVLSYTFDYTFYLGTVEGEVRGLPTSVYDKKKLLNELKWGIKEVEKKQNTLPVQIDLEPGTAVNVSLSGNYTKKEAPYEATLVSFYYNSSESMTRRISGVAQIADMLDVKIEFGQVYWRHNFTLVPTTTTTTTTTTTSTTPPTTTTQKEAQPVDPPMIDDDLENTIVDELNEIVTEDKYKMTELDTKQQAASTSNGHQIRGGPVIEVMMVSLLTLLLLIRTN